MASLKSLEKRIDENIKSVHVSKNTGENEWYTPSRYIEAARLTMVTIDLDPASSELANKIVNATVIYTMDDNGLNKEWFGNVWLNPPYAQPLMGQFSEKLVSELPKLTSVIVLVNNATETKWFQSMAKKANALCFPKTRIKFIDRQGKESGAPLQGQAFLYFGNNIKEFTRNFNQFGMVLSHAQL